MDRDLQRVKSGSSDAPHLDPPQYLVPADPVHSDSPTSHLLASLEAAGPPSPAADENPVCCAKPRGFILFY